MCCAALNGATVNGGGALALLPSPLRGSQRLVDHMVGHRRARLQDCNIARGQSPEPGERSRSPREDRARLSHVTPAK